ncbi:hypothetical protein PS15p_202986 [Mucor circinelloides]
MAYAEENPSKDSPKDTTNTEKLESYMIEAEDVEGIQVATIDSVASSELTAKIAVSNDVEKASAQLPLSIEEDGPDGGYGWLVVLGAFAVQITSFGVISSW